MGQLFLHSIAKYVTEAILEAKAVCASPEAVSVKYCFFDQEAKKRIFAEKGASMQYCQSMFFQYGMRI